MGKTVWARSLGTHSYFNGLFNVRDYDDKCEYAVFDDIDPKFFPNYKGWFGGQQQFTFSGKYARHRTINWGRPIIWCCNEHPRNTLGWDQEWLDGNSVTIYINEALWN